MKTIGDVLRERRIALGLSLAEAAQAVGVSAAQISRIERENRGPSLATLLAYAGFLRLNVLLSPMENAR